MPHVFLRIAIASAILAAPAAAQEQDAMSRWGEATLDKLERFLPNASPWGFTPEAAHSASDFKAFANDTPHRYPALVTHKTWYFSDPDLARQLDEVSRQKEALKKEMNDALDQFMKAHGAEMEAINKKHLADAQSVSQSHADEINALSKQAQGLFQQGKIQEGKAVIDKISAITAKDQDKLQPVHYAPYDEISASFKKKQQDLDDRERKLMALRRSVSFRIYTNRTPTTTAFAYPAKPIGMLASRTLYRQDRGTMDKGSGVTEAAADLAIYLGPANFVNPHIKAGDWDLKVKCIVVWAWIESLPGALPSDEATVKKVFEKIDYDGLSKLIEP
jgi:hypothetical protein